MLIVAAGTKISQMLLDKLANFAKVSGIQEPIQVSRSGPPKEPPQAAAA
jgi:hypothetical protein